MRNVTNVVDEVKLLTVTEVATALRVSKMTVYRLASSGELAVIKVGRAFRIHEHAFQAYLKNLEGEGKL
jgi:excisionase family DNA binding protein